MNFLFLEDTQIICLCFRSRYRYVQQITKGLAGFSGCLLQLILRAESPMQEQNVDLISGDRTELAWIGVDRLPSGLAEAPLCRSTDINPIQSNNQIDRQDELQPVHLDSVTQDQPLPENPCDRQPCGNGGSCELTSDVGYTCVCLPGWQGHHCDQGRKKGAKNLETFFAFLLS